MIRTSLSSSPVCGCGASAEPRSSRIAIACSRADGGNSGWRMIAARWRTLSSVYARHSDRMSAGIFLRGNCLRGAYPPSRYDEQPLRRVQGQAAAHPVSYRKTPTLRPKSEQTIAPASTGLTMTRGGRFGKVPKAIRRIAQRKAAHPCLCGGGGSTPRAATHVVVGRGRVAARDRPPGVASHRVIEQRVATLVSGRNGSSKFISASTSSAGAHPRRIGYVMILQPEPILKPNGEP